MHLPGLQEEGFRGVPGRRWDRGRIWEGGENLGEGRGQPQEPSPCGGGGHSSDGEHSRKAKLQELGASNSPKSQHSKAGDPLTAVYKDI